MERKEGGGKKGGGGVKCEVKRGEVKNSLWESLPSAMTVVSSDSTSYATMSLEGGAVFNYLCVCVCVWCVCT